MKGKRGRDAYHAVRRHKNQRGIWFIRLIKFDYKVWCLKMWSLRMLKKLTNLDTIKTIRKGKLNVQCIEIIDRILGSLQEMYSTAIFNFWSKCRKAVQRKVVSHNKCLFEIPTQ